MFAKSLETSNFETFRLHNLQSSRSKKFVYKDNFEFLAKDNFFWKSSFIRTISFQKLSFWTDSTVEFSTPTAGRLNIGFQVTVMWNVRWCLCWITNRLSSNSTSDWPGSLESTPPLGAPLFTHSGNTLKLTNFRYLKYVRFYFWQIFDFQVRNHVKLI